MSALTSAVKALHTTECDSGLRYDTQPELALAAVLQLLSRFPERQSPAVARAIADHLHCIGSDERIANSVRECAARLVDDWRSYALLTDQDSVPPSVLVH